MSRAAIERCDRVVFLARDGHLAFTGTPVEARRYFEVADISEVYTRLAQRVPPKDLGAAVRVDPCRFRGPPRACIATDRPPAG